MATTTTRARHWPRGVDKSGLRAKVQSTSSNPPPPRSNSLAFVFSIIIEAAASNLTRRRAPSHARQRPRRAGGRRTRAFLLLTISLSPSNFHLLPSWSVRRSISALACWWCGIQSSCRRRWPERGGGESNESLPAMHSVSRVKSPESVQVRSRRRGT